jgi:hypothetical protein
MALHILKHRFSHLGTHCQILGGFLLKLAYSDQHTIFHMQIDCVSSDSYPVAVGFQWFWECLCNNLSIVKAHRWLAPLVICFCLAQASNQSHMPFHLNLAVITSFPIWRYVDKSPCNIHEATLMFSTHVSNIRNALKDNGFTLRKFLSLQKAHLRNGSHSFPMRSQFVLHYAQLTPRVSLEWWSSWLVKGLCLAAYFVMRGYAECGPC